MRRLAIALVATANALQVLDYGPGRNHDLVEVGTDSVYVDFDEAITACEDQPSAAICVYENGKDRLCGDGAPEADAKRGVVKLPNELKQFDSRYDIALAQGVFCAVNGTAQSDTLRWTVQTVSEPEVDDEATTANTTTTVDQVEVYGLGIFVSDVASIDLQSSTWYGDVDVYVLKYYRPFLELESALKEATRPTDRGRACDVDSSDKWLFFKNEDLPELQFVNIGKNPSKNPIVQADRFDHLRVQSEFYFSPSIAEYPFQTQTLPITLELPPELSAGAPSKVLCLLETYSGFATKLSSFASVDEKDATLSAKVVVDEAARRPPFSRNCEAQLSYPSSGCPPTRQTSRLSLELKFAPPSRLGAFVLLPPSFIALFAIVSYAQSNAGLRLVYHVTLMLAAVTQHAAIRSALPPRAPTTAADDFAFCVYAVVAVAVLAAVAEMLAPKVRMDCLCLAPASLLIFVHARPPISLDAPLAVAVMLVFAGAAALACAWRMLYKPGGDPGGAYARVSSTASEVRRQSSLQENLLDDDDYKEDEPPESPSTTIRKRNLEMVERGGEFV